MKPRLFCLILAVFPLSSCNDYIDVGNDHRLVRLYGKVYALTRADGGVIVVDPNITKFEFQKGIVKGVRAAPLDPESFSKDYGCFVLNTKTGELKSALPPSQCQTEYERTVAGAK